MTTDTSERPQWGDDQPLNTRRPEREIEPEDEPETTPKASAARDEFMKLARDRFTESAVAEFALRERMLSDRKFASGGSEQWINEAGVDIQRQRWAENKPAVTTNQIPSYTRQVTNSMRESRPAIQYVAVDDDHDPEMAEVLQGLARHVEQNSMADIAYDTAGEHQVEGGRGWIYARTDFVHDETDEQDIYIKRVRNPDTVFPDPSCQEFDYSDMRYLHHIEDMPLDTYNRLYPKAPIASGLEFSALGVQARDWHWGADRIRVSNYYYVEYVEKTLVAVQAPPEEPPAAMPPQPGNVLNIQQQQQPPDVKPPKLRFLEDLSDEEKALVIGGARRTVKVPRPMVAKINGLGIVEGNDDLTAGREVPGRFIPYVPVIGGERDLNGEIDLRGMVRDMKEAQQMVNLWQSVLTEAIGKTTHGTWVIAEGQITDANKDTWRDANRKNFAFLPYKPLSLGNTLAPMPAWNGQAPEIQSIVVALQIAENKLRSCAGFQIDSEEQKPEVSGRAIMARQQQGERGASQFHGNLGRAIRHMGRILLHMFPVVYDTARIKRINGIDDQERAVQVFSGADNEPKTPQKDPQSGKPIKFFDLSSAGRYDVRTTIGPSMATKRQEAVAVLLDLAKAVPQVGLVGCDIIVKNSDFTGNHELAKRLKRVVVPPEALDEDEDTDAKLMKAMGTVQQVTKINGLLTKELEAKNKIIENDEIKIGSQERMKQADLASKELIEQNKTLLGILKVQLDAAGKAAAIEHQQDSQVVAQQHETEQGERGRQHEAHQSDQERQFGAQQKDQDRQVGMAQHREKLDAGREQATMKIGGSLAQTHLKGQQAEQITQLKGAQASEQMGAEQLQERVITTMDHSQQEHMAEITASQQREAQEREIQAQQDAQKQQQEQGGGAQGGA